MEAKIVVVTITIRVARDTITTSLTTIRTETITTISSSATALQTNKEIASSPRVVVLSAEATPIAWVLVDLPADSVAIMTSLSRETDRAVTLKVDSSRERVETPTRVVIRTIAVSQE